MASNKSVEVTTTKTADGSVIEKRVETVEFEPSEGDGHSQRRREVKVVHQQHPTGTITDSSASGMVAEAIQSAKDAISGNKI